MALTKDKLRAARGPVRFTDRAAIATASTIKIGSLVMVDTATGRIKPAAVVSGARIAGVANRFVTSNGGDGTGIGNTSGTQEVIYDWGREYELAVKTAYRTTTHLGLNLFVFDDDTVTGTAAGTAAARIVVGELTEFANSTKTKAYVAVRRFGSANIAV